MSAPAAPPMVVHNVFFALNENTPATRQKLIDDCRKYLSGHTGVAYFSTGNDTPEGGEHSAFSRIEETSAVGW